MRARILDNIQSLKQNQYTAGSETLDKILLDFYKMLYDERNPVQQDKYETAAFLVDFFQSYTKKLLAQIQEVEQTLNRQGHDLQQSEQQLANFQNEISNLEARLDSAELKLENEERMNEEKDEIIAEWGKKAKQLEAQFENSLDQVREMLDDANKQLDIQAFEASELQNKIISLEKQLDIEKDAQERIRMQNFSHQALVDSAQMQQNMLSAEIHQLERILRETNVEKEGLAKKVIELELGQKNMTSLQADLQTNREKVKRQNKELSELRRIAENFKNDSEDLKRDKQELEHYLRNFKTANYINELQNGIPMDNIYSYNYDANREQDYNKYDQGNKKDYNSPYNYAK